MKTAILIFTIFHILFCLLVFLLKKSRVLKASGQLLPIALLVPFWGMLMLFCGDFITRRQTNGLHPTDLHSFMLGQDDYRRIRVSDSDREASVIPLEEAILINDPKTRRQLMMDIISGDAADYVPLLQKARFNDDIEVAHYASTAIMEIQRNYELHIQQARDLCEQEPDNPAYAERLAKAQRSYIDSGLSGESVLAIERGRYADTLKKIAELRKEDIPLRWYVHAVDNEIELKRNGEAERLLTDALQGWPESEQLWLLKLKLCYQNGDGAALSAALSALEKAKIFLTPEMKEKISFWSTEGGRR